MKQFPPIERAGGICKTVRRRSSFRRDYQDCEEAQ
jgi:hypothetical protein